MEWLRLRLGFYYFTKFYQLVKSEKENCHGEASIVLAPTVAVFAVMSSVQKYTIESFIGIYCTGHKERKPLAAAARIHPTGW